MKKQEKIRPLIFGEVLFDSFPDGATVLGGAPFNVAWHLHAFGLKPLFISRIGNDELGNKVEAAMRDWGMDCSGLQKDTKRPTGTVQVNFNDGEPFYDIVNGVAYDFIDSSQLPTLDGSWLLYHGTLALRNENSARTLAKLKSLGRTKVFTDINLRPPWWEMDFVLNLINDADWVKLNESELRDIFHEEQDGKQQIQALSSLITEQIVLTTGEKGAMAISATDGDSVSVVPDSTSAVVDTVGAGDAFCSIFLTGLLLNWSLELSMKRAQEFAGAIVAIRGALSQDKSFYQKFIDKWNIKD